MENAGQRRQLGLLFCLLQHAFQRGIVNGLGLLVQLVASGSELGVNAAAVIGAQHPREQIAVFEPGNQSRRCAGAQGRGAGQLRHAHMPAVLTIQGIQKCVLDHREPHLRCQVLFKCSID